MNWTRTKAEARIRKERERKVPILSQNFQPRKHTVKKDIVISGNLTIGVPVYLMIPQVEPQEEKLQGMERDILHGWQQSHWILPTIQHTLFWILAAHGQLDQERQSEDSRNMRCITVLRQSFALATRPSCLPTLRPQESFGEQRFPEDFDYDDVTIGKTLLDACRRRADHSEEEGLSSCLSSSVSHDRTVRPVVCRDKSHERYQEIQRQNSESEQIRTLLERQREQILADCQAEIRKHEFQADFYRRSIRKLNETIESQKEEICRAHQGDERRRQDQQLLHEQLLKQNWDAREAHEKSLNEMEEWKRFQRFNIRDNCEEKIGRRSRYYPWTHWQDTGVAEWNQLYEWFERFSRCWISTQWTFSRCQSTCVFPTSSSSRWKLSRSIGMPSRKNGPPSIWDTHGISGNVFANPAASSSAPYAQESNPWSSHISEQIHSSPAEKSENQTPAQDQRCQSGPSAKSSVIPSEGHSSQNYGAHQQRLQISDLHFDKFPTPATFACWNSRPRYVLVHNFLRKLCCGPKKWRWLIQWMI